VAAAVAAAVAVPVGAQAEVSVYGRITNAIQFHDPAEPRAGSTTDISSYGSRFGFRASSDLGNGLTALGHFEFQANTDQPGKGAMKTRIGTVGLEGGFGKLTVGNQGAAFYGNVHFDQSIWNGGHGGYPGSRSSNTIKYANSVGPLSIQADLRLDGAAEVDSDGELQAPEHEDGTEGLGKGDGGAIGLQAAVTENLTLGFGYDTQDQTDMAGGKETDYIGLSGMVTMGQFWGSLAWANKEATGEEDTELLQFWGGASLTDQTSALLGYGQADQDESEATPNTITVGLVHNLGGGFRIWYEGNAIDNDDPDLDTEALHEVGLRFDF